MPSHILITESAPGMDRAISLCFARHGWTVTLRDTPAAGAAESLEHAITAAVGVPSAIQADIYDVAQVDRLFAAAHVAHGSLRVIVHNSVFALIKPPAGSTTEDFDRHFLREARGAFLLLQAAASYLAEAGAMLSKVAHPTGEILAFGRLRRLGPHRYRINAISPGGVGVADAPGRRWTDMRIMPASADAR